MACRSDSNGPRIRKGPHEHPVARALAVPRCKPAMLSSHSLDAGTWLLLHAGEEIRHQSMCIADPALPLAPAIAWRGD